jgi:hypothetical protein
MCNLSIKYQRPQAEDRRGNGNAKDAEIEGDSEAAHE